MTLYCRNQTKKIRGDALTLLRSLPDGVAAVALFDPQHRGVLTRLQISRKGATRGAARLCKQQDQNFRS
jgi:hypothetical protein